MAEIMCSFDVFLCVCVSVCAQLTGELNANKPPCRFAPCRLDLDLILLALWASAGVLSHDTSSDALGPAGLYPWSRPCGPLLSDHPLWAGHCMQSGRTVGQPDFNR